MVILRKNWYGIVGVALVVGGIAVSWLFFQAGHAATLQPLVQNAPYEVLLNVPRSHVVIGEPVRLDFTVRRDGQVADIYHDNVIGHYVIASENYQDFFHTFSPEESGPGHFFLNHTFTQPGQYRIWVELVDTTKGSALHHGAHAELVAFTDLKVSGNTATISTPPVESREAVVEDFVVKMTATPLQAGQPTAIELHVEDRQGNVLPVFVEEPAIYVMIGPSFEFFRHTHTTPARQGTSINITETFPTAGRYLFWTEIYVKSGESYVALQVPFALTVQ